MPMTMLEVLTAIALVFALLAFFGSRRKARLALDAAEERVRRYRQAVDDLDKWCGHEFPQARLIAAHLTAIGEGRGLNAGTPHGDEPCTVNSLREQLRRLAA